MADTFLANWVYGVGIKTASATFGTDPYAGGLDLGLSAGLTAFPTVEQNSSDGRDVVGSGEEGGKPKLLATRGQWNWETPRATYNELAWLLAYSLGDITTAAGSANAFKAHTVVPATTSGLIKRFTLETRQHGDVSKRFKDAFLNSMTLRMNTGASARTIAASAEIVMPSDAVAINNTAPVADPSFEVDSQLLAIRLKKGAPSTAVKENGAAKSGAGLTARGGNSPAKANTALTGSPIDVTARCDYWEYQHGNNVDIDNSYGFGTGLYMSEPKRGQRSHSFEIGIPYENDNFFDAADATSSYAVELVFADKTRGTSQDQTILGCRMLIPFAFLSAAPTLYAKGPEEFQRLNFVPKVSGTLPSILFDVFATPATLAA